MNDVLYRNEPDRPGKQFLSTREAANYLGVAKSTLEKWRAQDRGPAFHRSTGRGPHGSVLYRVVDLDAYIEANMTRHDTAQTRAAGHA